MFDLRVEHMRMRDLISWRLVIRVLAISFVGLAICRLADQSTGEFFSEGLGRIMVMLLSVTWCGALIVLLPLRIAWDKGERRKDEEFARRLVAEYGDPAATPPLERLVLLANFGSLPRWFYLPFLIVAVTLAMMTILALLGAAVWILVSWL